MLSEWYYRGGERKFLEVANWKDRDRRARAWLGFLPIACSIPLFAVSVWAWKRHDDVLAGGMFTMGLWFTSMGALALGLWRIILGGINVYRKAAPKES